MNEKVDKVLSDLLEADPRDRGAQLERKLSAKGIPIASAQGGYSYCRVHNKNGGYDIIHNDYDSKTKVVTYLYRRDPEDRDVPYDELSLKFTTVDELAKYILENRV